MTMKAQLKKLNGRSYLLFENGRISRLPDIDTLSLDEIKAAIELFSAEGGNPIEVVN